MNYKMIYNKLSATGRQTLGLHDAFEHNRHGRQLLARPADDFAARRIGRFTPGRKTRLRVADNIVLGGFPGR